MWISSPASRKRKPCLTPSLTSLPLSRMFKYILSPGETPSSQARTAHTTTSAPGFPTPRTRPKDTNTWYRICSDLKEQAVVMPVLGFAVCVSAQNPRGSAANSQLEGLCRILPRSTKALEANQLRAVEWGVWICAWDFSERVSNV